MTRELDFNKVVVEALKFQFNGITIKVKLNKIGNSALLAIGLNNPNDNYENWFSKIVDIVDDKIHFSAKIEHPPFRFYSRFLLVDNSLNEFYDVLFNHIKSAKINDSSVQNQKISTEGKQPRLYPVTFVRLPKDKYISGDTIKIIRDRFSPSQAERIIKHCRANNNTIRFTNNISKAKNLILN